MRYFIFSPTVATETKVIILGKQTPEKPEKIFIFNQFNTHRSKVINFASNGETLMWNIGNGGFLVISSRRALARRQGEITPLFSLQKKGATGDILKLTIDGAPVPKKC